VHVFGWHDDTKDPAVITRAKQRLLLAVLLQMSYPGAPTVYYGDEVGVTGGDDPYNRATYPWPDEGGKPDLALREQFKRLIAMRHAHPVLRRGELMAPVVVDEHVVVWSRRLATPDGERWALVAVNNGATVRTVRLPRPAGLPRGPLNDALGGPAVAAEGELIEFEVPALFGRVLLR
jgi:glycosidase